METAKKLDCTGLFCPMPVANAKIELDKLKQGEILEVSADDPGFEKDIAVWCKITGNELLELKKEDGVIKGIIKKK